jgi:hypothetical protein
MSRSESGKPDPDLEGVELLFHLKGESASFGAKMVLSLNGVDLGCMNPITGSTCRAKCSNLSYMISGINQRTKYVHAGQRISFVFETKRYTKS